MRTGRKPRKRKCSVSIQFESTEQKDENCRLRQEFSTDREQSLQYPAVCLWRVTGPKRILQTSVMNLDPQRQKRRRGVMLLWRSRCQDPEQDLDLRQPVRPEQDLDLRQPVRPEQDLDLRQPVRPALSKICSTRHICSASLPF
ncbi:uncharacterized protein LOC119485030 isoform X2 [Sebastes umbrosus]|uniref:uncharacterized protein LOC119485030 isoform X2 n=1 Tax=Sebastes umbrosus TaxID=72105 RepID=UPI00189EF7FF|nr:uncharacterized protein LOC119485030 isoform X2 [Sebastes umbrosus]